MAIKSFCAAHDIHVICEVTAGQSVVSAIIEISVGYGKLRGEITALIVIALFTYH